MPFGEEVNSSLLIAGRAIGDVVAHVRDLYPVAATSGDLLRRLELPTWEVHGAPLR